MDHAHHHALDGPAGLTPADADRLRQGVDVLLTRLAAWHAETPGACACDVVEVMARALAFTMLSTGIRLSNREFQTASNRMLRLTRDLCRDARRDGTLLARMRQAIVDLERP